MENITRELMNVIDHLTRDRRALHQIPELQFDLPKTQAYLLDALKETGAEIEVLQPTGILAFFDGGKKETAAFRSDMDALPIQEIKTGGYASTHPGRMHACGHDGHMAMLLQLARYAREHIAELPRNLLLIFQPAEEGGGGARSIASCGAFERRNVTYIFGLHVAPELPVGTLASRPGAFFSKSSEVYVTFRGKSAHAANSEEGLDALSAGADFLLRAQAMEKAFPAEVFRLLKFGKFTAGTAANIIAEEARLTGTLRAFDNNVFADLQKGLADTALGVEAKWGVQVDLDYSPSYPPLLNDPALYARAVPLIKGFDYRELPKPTMLSEDFSYYLEKAPGVFFKLGIGTGIPLHTPEFDFDESALVYGVEAMVALANLK